MTLVKKIGFALLVFFMSVGIFFLLSNNEQIKTNILRTSLELFGKELLAMVPEGNEKDLLVDRYNQFINKAENDEIPPEKIEKVAATILNLANQDSVISAEKAIDALELSELEPISNDSLSIRSSFIKRVPDFRMPLPFLWKLHDKKHMELANRLTAAREFHVFMRNMSIPDSCLDDMKKHYDFKQIHIVRAFDDTVPPVPCEASKLQQVFLNILKNGAEAMADVVARKAQPTFTLRVNDDGLWVRVEIEDNGPGMDAKTRRRIFEPFFTTKPVGKGTGLGLSVSYFIITENHGGKMDVFSTDGEGTRFVIRLPKTGKP